MPELRGRKSRPTTASSTLLLPALCPPTATICGSTSHSPSPASAPPLPPLAPSTLLSPASAHAACRRFTSSTRRPSCDVAIARTHASESGGWTRERCGTGAAASGARARGREVPTRREAAGRERVRRVGAGACVVATEERAACAREAPPLLEGIPRASPSRGTLRAAARAAMAPARSAQLPSAAVQSLLSSLDAEAAAKAAELLRLSRGGAPGGAYELCRGFARALEAQLQARGRQLLRHFSAAEPGGLAAALRALPLQPLFAPQHVRDVCARADGYQPFLVSPEAGLRALVAEGVELCRAPAHACLARVHAALAAVVRTAVADAAAAADTLRHPKGEVRARWRASEGGLHIDAPPLSSSRLARGAALRAPSRAFAASRRAARQAALEAAAEAALDTWHEDAARALDVLVSGEQQFISADFFRARAFAPAADDAPGCAHGGDTRAARQPRRYIAAVASRGDAVFAACAA
jgi:hypothetical protein